MQLVAKGPDIPDALLQAHEEGRVVFFCGAGHFLPCRACRDSKAWWMRFTASSAPRRMPSSRKHTPATSSTPRWTCWSGACPASGWRFAKPWRRRLQPKLRRKGATDTHAALLQLARSRDGALRLVTTNFDRIFARTDQHAMKPAVPAYPAPLLPIPKNSRWNGLVYLHGLLPEHPDDSALNRLVLTSGDFGLAYLTERWAARFVSELFRNYVVCFVGYSINDPVLRYMMDALAADRMLGEVTPQAYALGDCAPGQEKQQDHRVGSQGCYPHPLRGARRHPRPFSPASHLEGLGRNLPRRHSRQGTHRRGLRDSAPLREHPAGRLRRPDALGAVPRVGPARQTICRLRSRAAVGLAGSVFGGSLPARRSGALQRSAARRGG